jgi:hypothetical protein
MLSLHDNWSLHITHLRMQSFFASSLTGLLVHELVLFTGDFTTGFFHALTVKCLVYAAWY